MIPNNESFDWINRIISIIYMISQQLIIQCDVCSVLFTYQTNCKISRTIARNYRWSSFIISRVLSNKGVFTCKISYRYDSRTSTTVQQYVVPIQLPGWTHTCMTLSYWYEISCRYHVKKNMATIRTGMKVVPVSCNHPLRQT